MSTCRSLPINNCVSCESLDPSHLLSVAEVKELGLSTLWSISQLSSTQTITQDNNESTSASALPRIVVSKISRTFTAKNFQCALDAINAMGKIAEREGHHPDFHLTRYREVEVILYTHSLGGVTKNDVSMAQMFDKECDVVYSPKWLSEHPEAIRETNGVNEHS